MSLTRDELLHLAKLARISIEEEKLELFQGQLDEILNYVGRLQAVKLGSAHEEEAEKTAVVRADVPAPSSQDLLQALQSAFPDRADVLLRVPGVFEKPKD